MASITFRRLNHEMKTRLCVLPADHGRSTDGKVRLILREAVSDGTADPRYLAAFTCECFPPIGGIEHGPPPPPRSPMREPQDFA